jgi:hypothetical protein
MIHIPFLVFLIKNGNYEIWFERILCSQICSLRIVKSFTSHLETLFSAQHALQRTADDNEYLSR